MQKFIKLILAMFMNYSLIIGKTYNTYRKILLDIKIFIWYSKSLLIPGRTKQEQNILFFTWLFKKSMNVKK